MYGIYSQTFKDAEKMAQKLKAADEKKRNAVSTSPVMNKQRPPHPAQKPSQQSRRQDAASVSSQDSAGSERNSARNGFFAGRKAHKEAAALLKQHEERQRTAQEYMGLLQDAIKQKEAVEQETSETIFQYKQDAKLKLNSGNEPAAIRLMRQVKRYEHRLQNVSNRIEELQKSRFMLESALQATSHLDNRHNKRFETIDRALAQAYLQFDAEPDDTTGSIVADDDELLRELLLTGRTDIVSELPVAPSNTVFAVGPPVAEAYLVPPDESTRTYGV